ncbi:DUF3892 domain-containing protein [Candidatus Saccharibacteria bacterium]|nr:DUF3892 domain-containing protein [Candidatus Saccharibacteria bacterium]
MAYKDPYKREYRIYAIKKDDGNLSDPDAAIDKYYFREYDCYGALVGDYRASRQYVVNEVKAGRVEAWTWPNDHRGALCEACRSVEGVEYLKTIPNSNPDDNLSNLPTRED